MSDERVHTVYDGDEWRNEVEGHGVISRHPTKAYAILAGRGEAIRRATDHVIHREDGTIERVDSTINDPFPPPR